MATRPSATAATRVNIERESTGDRVLTAYCISYPLRQHVQRGRRRMNGVAKFSSRIDGTRVREAETCRVERNPLYRSARDGRLEAALAVHQDRTTPALSEARAVDRVDQVD